MSSLSGLSSTGINFTGLSSGIDSNKIIDGLTVFNQKRIAGMQAQQATISQSQATFSGLKVKLADLQTQLGKVARTAGGSFDARQVTSSDSDFVTGAASTTALTGTYSLTVQQLAQAQQLASGGVADPTTSLKTGTIDLRVGGGTTTTITISSGNNTIQGIATAINDANGDVRASVINDGSSYRLLLGTTKTGAANAITVTNNLTVGSGASINLSATTVQAAKDAQVVLGSGSGAITLTSSNNRLEGALDGVTLNLLKADPNKPITLGVAADTTGAKAAITSVVDSYNAVLDYIDKQSKYDATTQEAGVLLGNRDATDLRNELTSAFSTAVNGVGSKVNRITAIGIAFDDKGKLVVDSTKLDSALNGQTAGVAMNDIRRLFSLSGTSPTPGVSFVLGSDKTRPSGSLPYQVHITQAATRAVISGGTALTGPVTITTGNNTFGIKVNSLATVMIHLDPGTYTPAALASAIQAQVNTANPGQVAVDLDSNRLRFSSIAYGGNQKLAVDGGTGVTDLGFTGTETSQGQNVAGNFVANSVTEAATGNGQDLTGATTNTNTAGMQIRVGLTPTAVGSGVTADLTVTQGLAARLNQAVTRYLDPTQGRLKAVDNGLQQHYDDIGKSIDRANASLEAQKLTLLTQFAAMESSVSSLKNLGNTISGSFGVLSYK